MSSIVDKAFIEEHGAWMLKLAEKILGDRELARDAVQEGLLSAHTHHDTFEGRSTLKTWLYRITVNAALAQQRKLDRQPATIEELQPVFDSSACRIESPWDELKSTEELLAQEQQMNLVRQAIRLLPDDYRICLQLRDVEELSVADIANILEISESNVKVRTHRARSALKRLLEPLLRGEAMDEINIEQLPTEASPSLMRIAKGLMTNYMLGMLTCQQFEDFIMDYLEDNLPRHQKRLFEFHLRTCRECRDYMQAYNRSRELAGAISHTRQPEDIPTELAEIVAKVLQI